MAKRLAKRPRADSNGSDDIDGAAYMYANLQL